ncbi:MAG: PEP/pyruvate-binding domain-containing protein [Acidobacteriota bacterium]
MIWHPGQGGSVEATLLGGKARGLASLEAAGLSVPPWFVVTAEAFRRTLAASGLGPRVAARIESLGADPAEVQAAAKEIGREFEELEPPEEIVAEIEACRRDLLGQTRGVAVRSSATDEDGSCHSFAGLYETVLAASGKEAVVAALRRVWASAFGAAALSYRREVPSDGVAMAVVVQAMVEAQASGVCFTANPVTGEQRDIVISSLYGLGEGLVGEGLAADRFTVRKATLELETELAHKREQMQPAGACLERIAVPDALRDRPSLSQQQVLELARAGKALERRLGRPQDVEFAVDKAGQVFFLQTRPITTLEEAGPAAGSKRVWDHENWAENYPGICLPMTFSIARRLEEVQYGCFGEMMRIDPRVAERHRASLGSSLGYIRGRLLTDGVKRYRLLSLIPGINFKRRAFLSLLSVLPEEMDSELEASIPNDWRTRYVRELPALLRLFGGLLRDLGRIDGDVEELLAAARRFHDRALAMDFDTAQPHEMVDLYEEVEASLLTRWTAPMRNVFLLRLLYVLLKALCRSWCGDSDESLVNELMRSEEIAQSARPVRELLALAGLVHGEPKLRDLFQRLSPSELAERLPAETRFPTFTQAVHGYLETYYFKGLFEMKLEAETIRDRPEMLYGMIRGHLLNSDPESFDLEALAQRDREARLQAEATAFARFGWKPWRLPQRLVFSWLLRRVRRLDAYREEVKFLRLQLIGTFRELIRGWGGWLAREGVLEEPGDVFYLSLDEVLSYFNGRALTTDFRGLVEVRRREVESWHDTEAPDDSFITYGVPYHKNRFRSPTDAVQEEDEPGVLRGTGCCHGEVEATIQVLDSPLDTVALSGEILVAERLHGGWLHLLSSASGVLVESGEILSHAATVARELGVPTIVGIPGLLESVHSGQLARMDGAKGTVTLLDPHDDRREGTDR